VAPIERSPFFLYFSGGVNELKEMPQDHLGSRVLVGIELLLRSTWANKAIWLNCQKERWAFQKKGVEIQMENKNGGRAMTTPVPQHLKYLVNSGAALTSFIYALIRGKCSSRHLGPIYATNEANKRNNNHCRPAPATKKETAIKYMAIKSID